MLLSQNSGSHYLRKLMLHFLREPQKMHMRHGLLFQRDFV
jgi:hypothetical protein